MRYAQNAHGVIQYHRDAANRAGDVDSAGRLTAALEAPMAAKKYALAAEANHGRWIVHCPCGSADHTTPGDRRFMCSECLNVGVEGKWRPVIWPADVDKISAQLDQRPLEHQNWLPGETLTSLRAEEAAADQVEWVSSQEYRDQHAVKGALCASTGHPWPKRLPQVGDVECPECGLILPAALLREDRAQQKGA